jgi:hypothetical protein
VDGDRSGQAFGDLEYGNFRIHGLFSTRTKIIPTASYAANFGDSTNRSTDSRAYVDLSYHRALSLGDVEVRGYYDLYDFLEPGAYGGADPATRDVEMSWAGAGLELRRAWTGKSDDRGLLWARTTSTA